MNKLWNTQQAHLISFPGWGKELGGVGEGEK
jgi:hypothetical protein